MAQPELDILKDKQESLKRQLDELRSSTRKVIWKATTKLALKLLVGVYATAIAGALILKPLWVAIKFLWSLY